MDEMKLLAPFLAALEQTISNHQTSRQSDQTLNQTFKSLVQEKVADAADSTFPAQFSTGRVVCLPVRNHVPHPGEPETPLKICRPLPDEIIQGWRGRMRAANCMEKKEEIEELIAAHACGVDKSAPDKTDFFQSAACVLNMPREQLLKQHTLMPFFNTLSELKANKPGTKSLKHKEASERHTPFKFGGKHPKYCWQCALEELLSSGYSYWKISHQIPGVLWCSNHGTHLLTATRRDAFNHCPHEIMDEAINEKIRDLTLDQTELLKRYAFIANQILVQVPDIDSRTASITFGKMARCANLRFSKIGTRSTVSNELMKRLPLWWLNEVSKVTWIPNKYISSVDGICSPDATRYTTAMLSLLAALFYEDGELAVAEILKPTPCVQNKAAGSAFWGSKKVLDEYIAQHGVVSRVAEQLSMPNSTTSFGLLTQGLPGLGRSTAAIRAAHAFLSGESLEDACISHNALCDEVQTLLRISGIKLKNALDKIEGKARQNLQSRPPTVKNARKG